MRTITKVAIVVAILATLTIFSAANGAELAADWTLMSADGETVSLREEVERQPVVLFFWATWCPYCKALMPHLQSIRLEYGEDVKILAINFREDDDPVAFIEATGYEFTVLPNGDDVAKLYEVWGTPGIIVIGAGREVVFDLRALPRIAPPESTKADSHRAKAAYQAPYWAAAIRLSLDALLQESSK